MRRLVTRSDFDGLVCAMLLKEIDAIDDILFVHPKDVQDGKIELKASDITTNLPFDWNVGMAFDHHSSELSRVDVGATNGRFVVKGEAKSAARVVYDYYGGSSRFTRISEEIMTAVDKCDSADFTEDEILNPSGWILMNFIMDARTGLGRFHDFTVSNYDLMMKLIDFCLNHPVEQVLELPDVKERVDLYFEHQEKFKEQLQRCTRVDGKVGILDLRNEEVIYAGNRFMIYALFPEIEVSVHIVWGIKKQNTALMLGQSIINRNSGVDIGQLCLYFGGGGHKRAGTCQVDNNKVDETLLYIINELNKEG